ncbi:MAG: CDP-alcohol phosphatidyltransferase family protein [Candidatus Paceibacterota bacterium]
MSTRKITLPNALSLARMIAGPVIVSIFFLCDPTLAREVSWISIYVLACLSDFLDGWIARTYPTQASLFGEYIDQLADKVFIGSLTVFIFFEGVLISASLESWQLLCLVVIILREARVSYIRGLAVSDKTKIPSGTTGKWKTGFQMVAIGLLLGRDSFFAQVLEQTVPHISFDHAMNTTLIVALVLTLLSWIEYEKSYRPNVGHKTLTRS